MWSASSITVTATRRGEQALLHQVLEPPGAGDDDVDAGAAAPATCGFCETPPKMVVTVETRRRGQRRERRRDLGREFAGRGQDEAGGVPRAALARRRARLTSGSREGERLAAAGLAAAEDVTTGEGVGQGLLLDGEGRGDSTRGERVDQGLRYAEIGEGLVAVQLSSAFRASVC